MSGALIGQVLTGVGVLAAFLVSMANRRETKAKADLTYISSAEKALGMVRDQADRAIAEIAELRGRLEQALVSHREEREHRVRCEAELSAVRARLARLENGAA